MQLWAVIVDSIRESLDRKIFWVLCAMTGFVVLVMVSIGFEEDRVTFVFGMLETQSDYYNPLTSLGREHVVGIVVHTILSVMLSWVGVVVAIIATAGIFPAMLQSGAIDVLLAKPISRPRLFMYKYVAAMVFILLHAFFFVFSTFLVMGFRWGVWAPGYLLSIPLVVLLFSYVYCVSVVVSVKTRSTVAAIMLSIGAWMAFALVSQAPGIFESYPTLKTHTLLHRTVKLISWIPPKTGHMEYVAARWASAGTSVDAMPAAVFGPNSGVNAAQLLSMRAYERELIDMHPIYPIGSSLLFEAAVLLVAMWIFTRQDH